MLQKVQPLRYMDMLYESRKEIQRKKERLDKKKYKTILSHNMQKFDVMKIVYSKQSLAYIQDKQSSVKVHHKIERILGIRYTAQYDNQSSSKKGGQLFTQQNSDSIQKFNPQEKFKILQKDNHKLCLYDQETLCELTVENTINLQHLKARYIWNNTVKLHENSNLLIVIYGNSKSGKKRLLFNQKGARPPNDSSGTINENKNLDSGFLEIGMQHMLALSRSEAYSQVEVLISVVGFVKDKIIDLLNIDQDLTTLQGRNLRIKREESNGIGVKNLVQMGVRNDQELQSIMALQQSLKSVFSQYLENKIDTIVYQICLAKMNPDRTKIESILNKMNFVKMTNNPQNYLQVFSLCQCFRTLSKPSSLSETTQLPTKNSKLTFFLEDSLNNNQNIYFVGTLSQDLQLQDQLQTIKTFNSVSPHSMYLKHNYMNDMNALKRIYQDDLDQARQLMIQLSQDSLGGQFQVLQSNKRPDIKQLKKEKLIDKNLNLSIHLPRIYGHTKSSIKKQRTRSITQDLSSQFGSKMV